MPGWPESMNALFHRLWTRDATYSPIYSKKEWQRMERMISELWRIACEDYGEASMLRLFDSEKDL